MNKQKEKRIVELLRLRKKKKALYISIVLIDIITLIYFIKEMVLKNQDMILLFCGNKLDVLRGLFITISLLGFILWGIYLVVANFIFDIKELKERERTLEELVQKDEENLQLIQEKFNLNSTEFVEIIMKDEMLKKVFEERGIRLYAKIEDEIVVLIRKNKKDEILGNLEKIYDLTYFNNSFIPK